MAKRTCSVDGCGKEAQKREWCGTHYYKVRKYGDPLAGGRHYKTPQESFEARTTRQGECLIWGGWSIKSGSTKLYGMIAIGDGEGSEQLVHRWVWEQHNGPIPHKMEIDHRCHNTLCAEITHLRLATYVQNAQNIKGPRADNTSGYLGVSWDKSRNKWAAYVSVNKRLKNLGRYDDVHVAGSVAREARLKYYTHNDHDRV